MAARVEMGRVAVAGKAQATAVAARAAADAAAAGWAVAAVGVVREAADVGAASADAGSGVAGRVVGAVGPARGAEAMAAVAREVAVVEVVGTTALVREAGAMAVGLGQMGRGLVRAVAGRDAATRTEAGTAPAVGPMDRCTVARLEVAQEPPAMVTAGTAGEGTPAEAQGVWQVAGTTALEMWPMGLAVAWAPDPVAQQPYSSAPAWASALRVPCRT